MTTAQATIAILPPGQREPELREATFGALEAYEIIVAQRAFDVCHSQCASMGASTRVLW